MPISPKTGRALAAAAAFLMLAACGNTPTGAEDLPIYPTVQSGQALLPDWEHIPQNEVLEEDGKDISEMPAQTGDKQPDKTDSKTENKTDDKSGDKTDSKTENSSGQSGDSKDDSTGNDNKNDTTGGNSNSSNGGGNTGNTGNTGNSGTVKDPEPTPAPTPTPPPSRSLPPPRPLNRNRNLSRTTAAVPAGTIPPATARSVSLTAAPRSLAIPMRSCAAWCRMRWATAPSGNPPRPWR